jgi:hypothetical protein
MILTKTLFLKALSVAIAFPLVLLSKPFQANALAQGLGTATSPQEVARLTTLAMYAGNTWVCSAVAISKTAVLAHRECWDAAQKLGSQPSQVSFVSGANVRTGKRYFSKGVILQDLQNTTAAESVAVFKLSAPLGSETRFLPVHPQARTVHFGHIERYVGYTSSGAQQIRELTYCDPAEEGQSWFRARSNVTCSSESGAPALDLTLKIWYVSFLKGRISSCENRFTKVLDVRFHQTWISSVANIDTAVNETKVFAYLSPVSQRTSIKEWWGRYAENERSGKVPYIYEYNALCRQ